MVKTVRSSALVAALLLSGVPSLYAERAGTNPHPQWGNALLWTAGFIGHVALVLVLIIRKRWRDVPVFTAFVAYEVFTTILLFVVSRHGTRHDYFFAYWITGFADYIFQMAVLYEVARDVFCPTGTWLRDARNSFLGWGLAGVIATCVVVSQLWSPQARGIDLWDARITVFTSLLTCTLFVAMSWSATSLGLHQRSYVFAIGQGFTAWAFCSLLEEFGRAIFGWDPQFVIFVHIRMIIYLAVLVYWMVVFWLPEKERAPLSPEMRAYLVALHEQAQHDLERID